MNSSSTSASLLQRARKLEATAWERLCLLYGPIVYGWCRRAGLQESDAADASQEVFRSVYQHLGQFQGESFRAWLWGITRNQIRQHYRDAQQQAQAQGGTESRLLLDAVPDPELPESEHQAESTRSLLVHRALELIRDDFTPQTWTIFQRTTMQDESCAEVARELGLSSNAVRQARYRVLCRLREELEQLL